MIGMGRAPKVNRVLLEFATFGSSGTPDQTNYIPPRLVTDIWVESWLPAAYMGGNNVIPPQGLVRKFGTATEAGGASDSGALNCSDMQRDSGEGSTFSAALKKANGGDSFWANQLLTTKLSGPDEAGIDFNANAPESGMDPDELFAQLYHDPFALPMVRRHTGVPGSTNSHLPSSCLPRSRRQKARSWLGAAQSVPNRFGWIGPYYLPMRKKPMGKYWRFGAAYRFAVRSSMDGFRTPIRFPLRR